MPVVLLVDDQPFIGIAVQGLVASDPGLELHVCHDPRQALDLAVRVRPAVVLIDLVMPEIDGLSLIRRFRGDPRTSAIPIVAMSGNADERSRGGAMAAGAADFIVKLPSREELVAIIRRHAAAAVQGASPPVKPDNDQTLDREAVAALRDADPEAGQAFVTSLIDMFVDEAAAHVEQLRDAVARSDSEAMRQLAHKLSGSSQTIGARKLATLSGQLEDHARRNRGAAVGRVLVAEIADEFARVRAALALERSAERAR